MRRVQAERIIDAPPADVFARYTDHAAWSEWAGLGEVSLTKEGSPSRNGVGAVRAFRSAPGLREEVLSFDPPRSMTYRVAHGGFPLKDHRGEVLFEAHPRGTRIVWSAEFDSRVPLTAGALARFIQKMFETLLARFERRGMAAAGGRAA
jgi:uncharacterized protein YndB with AHSA1/START domain